LLQVADSKHPVARYFEERPNVTHLRLISFYSYYLTNPTPDAPALDELTAVSVPFRYSDLERSPAIFDNAFGKGRALWFLSSADVEWNDFSRWPDFVVFLYESMSYLVQFGTSSMNLNTGDFFQKRYQDSEFASQVVLHSPEGDIHGLDKTHSLTKIMRKTSDGVDFEITHDETSVPGLYKLDLQRPNRPEPNTVEYFAVNVATEESDLRPMLGEDFRASVEELAFQDFDAFEDMRKATRRQELLRGQEYWRWFLSLVLGLLALETILAYLFGRRTR
jgi:hypothetical protein